ncbi:Protein of unknown function [Aquiflexum balticum DSM 16537]|uniref:Uncharacterized protein n=1 Tax=Aquiflexum balticum DSM 16537 TaxID=758820 RepID=A0A1W2H8D3_9BACT|nr:DUF4230 domain-containing protein [Aquiflexum balticum]SMD45064.1 Protein of unknown function [Aquiflexum balticum DSM 16537]
MIGMLLKNWKFILDIVIVLAVVVLIFLWNPFGIFGGGVKLKDTANMVAEVNQIGQLVTAEYYGEVIASIDEARLDLIEEENISNNAAILFRDIKSALGNLKTFQELSKEEKDQEYKKMTPINGWRRIIRFDVNSRNITDKLNYHGFMDDIAADPLYDEMLEYLYRFKSKKPRNVKWEPNPRHKEEALVMVYNELPSPNETLDVEDFMRFYYQNKTAELSKRETRKKLAMVGRGWVKAGFDFSELKESSIVINEERGEIHIMGLTPQILNADINPWFIPEKGIPGFEILDDNGKVDFKDAKLVKEYCVEKLLAFAHRADILQKAEDQASETLKNLFTLITGKEIKKVVFHNDRIFQIANRIEKEEAVSRFDVVLLDSLLQQEFDTIQKLTDSAKIDPRLRQSLLLKENNIAFVIKNLRNISLMGMDLNYGYFSKEILAIASNGILDKNEIQILDSLRIDWELMDRIDYFNKSIPYPIYYWYDNPGEYISDFNAAISFLMNKNLVFGELENVTKNIDEVDSAYLAENKVLNSQKISETEIVLTQVRNPIDAKDTLFSLLYPYQYNSEIIADFISSEEIMDIKSNKSSISDSLIWLLYSKDQDTVVHWIPEKFLGWVEPNIKTLLKDEGAMNIANKFILFRDQRHFTKVHQDSVKMISPRQSLEMAAFIELLINARSSFQTKGPLERANSWVKKKFEQRRSEPTWLTSFRESVSRP